MGDYTGGRHQTFLTNGLISAGSRMVDAMGYRRQSFLDSIGGTACRLGMGFPWPIRSLHYQHEFA